MYGYYFLATLGIQPWWKRLLTRLQISQLSLMVVQGISLLFNAPEKDFRFIGLINSLYAFTLLALFVNFYRQSYITDKKQKERERAPTEKKKVKKAE